eukprot:3163158-Prymnesium_polylepis.1
MTNPWPYEPMAGGAPPPSREEAYPVFQSEESQGERLVTLLQRGDVTDVRSLSYGYGAASVHISMTSWTVRRASNELQTSACNDNSPPLAHTDPRCCSIRCVGRRVRLLPRCGRRCRRRCPRQSSAGVSKGLRKYGSETL